jgi:hypothetical protein
MEISIFLAKVIGFVSTISAVAVLVRYKKSLALDEEAARNPAVAYFGGFGILILGVLIIVSHSVWSADWRVVITIIGWLVLLKGIGRIFFPDSVGNMIAKKKDNRLFILGEFVVLLVGLYLLYYGFLAY